MRFWTVAVLCTLATEAAAKDNSVHTLGFGYSTQFGGPGLGSNLSFKAALRPTLELQGLFGFSVQDAGGGQGGPTNLYVSTGAKLLFILVPHDNLNFYVTAGAGVSFGTPGFGTVSYFFGPGVEFFFSGLENLGFFGEFGLGGTHRGQPFLSTSGAAFLGVHYYF